jgi:hypothetical protein
MKTHSWSTVKVKLRYYIIDILHTVAQVSLLQASEEGLVQLDSIISSNGVIINTNTLVVTLVDILVVTLVDILVGILVVTLIVALVVTLVVIMLVVMLVVIMLVVMLVVPL